MNGHKKQKEASVRMIEEALFMLMRRKKYRQITVSEIVKRADVSRRTFYRFYGEKDEVLRCYLRKLCREYQESAPTLACYNITQISREYFCFWYRYKEFLLLMYKSGLDEMLYYEISRASLEVVKGRIEGAEYKNVTGIEYFADYSTGGFVLLLQRWVESGMKETPEQYADAVSKSLLIFGLIVDKDN